MIAWLEALNGLQLVLFAFASIGSLLFLIYVIMMLLGGGDSDAEIHADASGMDADVDADVDLHADVSADHEAEAAHADSDTDFKVISVQGTVAFFMMLGWVGLAANRAWGLGAAASVGLGVGAGAVANLFIAKMFQFFKKMQSSGTMDMKNALGQEGEVYLTIKKDGAGKVRVSVQEHLKVFDAISADGEDLPTGTRVVVVRVVKGDTMVVKKASA